MRFQTCGAALALLLSCACGGGDNGPSPSQPTAPTPNNPPTSSITIEIVDNEPLVLQTTQARVFETPVRRDVTAQATWESSNGSVATVSGSGLITPLAVGRATITGRYQGQSATAAVNVLSPYTQVEWSGTWTVPGEGAVPIYLKVTMSGNSVSVAGKLYQTNPLYFNVAGSADQALQLVATGSDTGGSARFLNSRLALVPQGPSATASLRGTFSTVLSTVRGSSSLEGPVSLQAGFPPLVVF